MLAQTLFDLAFVSPKVVAGGGGSTVSPSDAQFGTMVRWYDADTYSATKVNNDLLSSTDTWTDQSLTASAATPDNGGKPTFKTNIFGTKPAVLFTSITRMTFPGTLTFGDFTAIIITSGSGDSIIPYNQGVNMQIRICRTATKNSFFPNDAPEVLSNVLNTPQGFSKANVWIRSGSQITFFENSASVGSFACSTNGFTTNALGSTDGGPLNNCHVGLVLYYSTAMSTSSYQTLYTDYLKPRFGLP